MNHQLGIFFPIQRQQEPQVRRTRLDPSDFKFPSTRELARQFNRYMDARDLVIDRVLAETKGKPNRHIWLRDALRECLEIYRNTDLEPEEIADRAMQKSLGLGIED